MHCGGDGKTFVASDYASSKARAQRYRKLETFLWSSVNLQEIQLSVAQGTSGAKGSRPQTSQEAGPCLSTC